jgi:hypothetical protein
VAGTGHFRERSDHPGPSGRGLPPRAR